MKALRDAHCRKSRHDVEEPTVGQRDLPTSGEREGGAEGEHPTREAARATEVISATTGVQRVVRILETISDDELGRMSSTPSKVTPKQ